MAAPGTYTPVLVAHIAGGLVGFVAGSVAFAARKGGTLHRRAGVVFAVSMLLMAASGAWVAFTKSELVNMVAGSFTVYLVGSAWLTARRKENEAGLAEIGFLALALAVAAAGATGLGKGGDAGIAVVFGVVALLAAAGDARLIARGGIGGNPRLVRHLWRMGVGLFIAAGSFFLGTSGDPAFRETGLRARLFTKEIRATHLPEVPVLLVVCLTVFWVFRVKLAKGRPVTAPRTAASR